MSSNANGNLFSQSARIHNPKAFTLAETLITLVIVGVVAALTLPIMIAKYQKEQTVTKLKKAYGTVNSALQSSIAKNGNMNSWDCQFVLGDTDEKRAQCLKKYFVPYLRVMDECYYNEKDAKNCWSGATNWYYNITGTSGAYCISNGVIIDDGMLFGLSCTATWPDFMIDINGRKKPNRLGKDVFRLSINKNKGLLEFQLLNYSRDRLLNPSAFDGNGGACVRGTKRYDGWGCGALILKDGWNISDDYPW